MATPRMEDIGEDSILSVHAPESAPPLEAATALRMTVKASEPLFGQPAGSQAGGGQPTSEGAHPTRAGHVFPEGASALHGARLLVVDGKPLALEAIVRTVELDGARVAMAESGEAAIAAFDRAEFDLVILDIDLPGRSGFEMLRRLRERSDVPVIITTGKSSVADRVAAFDLGADDYVRKPAEVPELSSRARVLLRRSRGTDGLAVEELEGPGGLILKLRSREVLVHDIPLNLTLTPKEFAVLRLLLHRRGEVISPDALSLAIWGYETFGSRNFVEAHISRLRAKLARGGADQVVTTIRGVGYVIR